MKHKVVTILSDAKRVVSSRGFHRSRQEAWRRYRRRVRQEDFTVDDLNLEPTKRERFTNYDAC